MVEGPHERARRLLDALREDLLALTWEGAPALRARYRPRLSAAVRLLRSSPGIGRAQSRAEDACADLLAEIEGAGTGYATDPGVAGARHAALEALDGLDGVLQMADG